MKRGDLYLQIRHQIRSGDLVVYRGRGLGPWLIRHWTQSAWAHVGITWCIGGRVLLLEATPFKGVRALPLSRKPPDLWLPAHAQWCDAAERTALENLGQTYGWLDCLRAALGLPTSPQDGIQCAEYAGAILAAARPGFPEPQPATPAQLIYALLRATSQESPMPIPYEIVPESTPGPECLAIRDAGQALYVERGETTPIPANAPDRLILDARASGRLGKISPGMA